MMYMKLHLSVNIKDLLKVNFFTMIYCTNIHIYIYIYIYI